ncbi:MAG: ATP-dependent helicase, partial [Bacteroidota bacterium]|nr:ATP-dependent helicase [Bacteroidota bacterium]
TKAILYDPVEINIALSKPAEGVEQQAYVIFDMQKGQILEHILKTDPGKSIVIFAGRKIEVRNLTHHLQKKGFDAKGMHSDLEQSEREEVMLLFRNRRLRVLVATDVVSRGIDIDDIDLVINYDVPRDPEDYVHRVGRTARAAKKGKAITFVNEKQMREFGRIETLIGYEVKKMQLPDSIPQGPAYDPKSRVADKNQRRPGGGRRQGGGVRPRS